MGRKKTDLTPEMLSGALEESKGFVLAALKALRKEYELDISYSLIKSRSKEWGMEEWLEDLRKGLVEDCMNRVFYKGIQKLDNHCIFWVLEKYGHHVDFLGDRKSTRLNSTHTDI